jgi:GTP-binding protein HflX
VLADAKMFATLDPTVRQIRLPSRRSILLSDTVGFIRNLPTTLVQAFRATLEEVAEAAMILHVVDASSPDAAVHVAEVFRILGEIGASGTAQILVLNKCDLIAPTGPGWTELPPDAKVLAARLLSEAGHETPVPAVLVSGMTGEGVANLYAQIDAALTFDPVETVVFCIPTHDGASIALLHEHGKVLSEVYDGDSCTVEVAAPESLRRRLKRYRAKTSGQPVENSVHN